jgi:hypothetical protein
MNGHSSEQAMSIRQAAQWIASHTGAAPPNPSTVNRWVVSGVRGVRLQARRVGAKFWTSPSDVARFLDELNASPGSESTSGTADSQPTFQQSVRQRQVEAACARLDGLCAGFDGFANETKDDQAVRTVPVEEKIFRPTGAIGGLLG